MMNGLPGAQFHTPVVRRGYGGGVPQEGRKLAGWKDGRSFGKMESYWEWTSDVQLRTSSLWACLDNPAQIRIAATGDIRRKTESPTFFP